MLKHLITVSLLTFTTISHADPAAPSAANKIYPVQAELVASFSASKLKVGDRVLAKLKQQWIGPACTLPRGSALLGHVISLDLWSRSSRAIRLGMLFDLSCPSGETQELTWIALLGPDDSDLAGLHDGNPVARQALRSGSFGEDNGLRPASNTMSNHTDLSGRQNPNLPVSLGPAPDRSHPRPTSVFTGQVWGLPDLTLGVSSGPLGSSVLSSTKKDIHIPAGAVLVLSPPRAGAPPNASAPAGPDQKTRAGSAEASLSRANAPPASDAAFTMAAFTMKDQCQPPTCSLVPRAGAFLSAAPIQTLSLAPLRYQRLKSAEMLDLEFGAALAFLGPDHLLFTFNSHNLVPRHPSEDPASHPHMVRAILFNLLTSTIEATDEWRINDDRQYLWPLGDERVLVHSGDRLRILALRSPAPVHTSLLTAGFLSSAPAGGSLRDAGLKETASVSLPSTLAFVRTAPDRQHIAIGVLKELHNAEVHAALAQANVNGPEEEVSILLLDQSLQSLGSSRQSSYAMPPVFSNRGRITLLHSGGDRWRYQETSWADTPQTLARIRSACIPEMSSMAGELFFITGCDNNAADRWYRVLRSDGSTALRGTLLTHEMAPLPLAGTAGDTFALALPSAHDGYLPNGPFHGADLASEIVRVFRSADGQSIFGASIHAPSPTRQPLALSPGATHVALLDGDKILIYPVRSPSPESRPAQENAHAATADATAEPRPPTMAGSPPTATYPAATSSNTPALPTPAAPLN